MIAAAAAAVAQRFLTFSWHSLVFPYPLAYGEGEVLDTAMRLSRFENIYAAVDLKAPPWLIANYPPGFYLSQIPFIWIVGPALWYGRLVSQLSAVLTAFLIAAVLYRLCRNRAAAVISGLLFLAIPYVAVWPQYTRVDMLALALAWGGLWSTTILEPPARLPLAAACFIVSSYTKQTAAFPALAAAFVWLRYSGFRTESTRLLMVVIGGGLTLLISLNAVTHGGFIFHTVTATVGQMSIEQLRNFVLQLVDLLPYLLIITAAAVIVGAFTRPPGWTIVAAYTMVSAIVSLSVAKEGSYINYFLDLSAACSLAAGAAAAWLYRFPPLATALLVVIGYQAIDMGRSNDFYNHLSARLKRASAYTRLADVVRNATGPVLADEALGLLTVLNRPVELYPFAMTQLAHGGLWDEAPFIHEVENEHFSLILVRMVRPHSGILLYLWSKPMAAAIEQHYQESTTFPVDDTAVIAVLRPKRPGDSPIASFRNITGVKAQSHLMHTRSSR